MEQTVRLFTERLAEIVPVKRPHVGVFVREAQRPALVEPSEHAVARLRQLLPVVDGLTAARAAAGTGHDIVVAAQAAGDVSA